MKKLMMFLVIITLSLGILAQAPEKLSYQFVVRNASKVLVVNQSVGLRISILQGNPGGTVVYQETYIPIPSTNSNGLVSIEIGSGSPQTGAFSAINWAAGPYFLKAEADPSGGSDYSIIGTTQLISVPYSLYAKTVDYNNLTNKPVGMNFGDMQYWNGADWILIPVGKVGQYLQLTPSNVPSWTGPAYPTIFTSNISSITSSSATGGGNITDDGGSNITARGVCWGTTANPSVSDSHTSDGAGNGIFTSSLTDLTPKTLYYIRAYATNTIGTAYGNQESFTTLSNTGPIPTEGLISYYPFNGNANDESGNGNNATLTGSTFVTGKIGASLQLASGDHGDVPDNSILNPGQVSISLWVNLDRIVTEGNQWLISKGNDGTQGSYYITQNEGSQFHFYLGANGVDQVVAISQTISLKTNTWYHIVGTYNGMVMNIYVDGVLSGTTTAQYTIGNSQPLCIGYQNRPLWPYYTMGRLDQIRIYNRALTEQEIQSLYNE